MANDLSESNQSDTDFLTEIQGHIKTLREELAKRFPEQTSSFIHRTAQQQLQQAESALGQALRNIKIDAELDAKKAEELVKNG